MRGLPVPPPERRLPDHERRREELLRTIGRDRARGGLRRRWGLPLGVAAAVAATGMLAVTAVGGGAARPHRAVGPLAGTPTVSAPDSAPPVEPNDPVITAGTPESQTDYHVLGDMPEDLPSGTAWKPVIAVKTPVPTANEDAVEIYKDTANNDYRFYRVKGDVATILSPLPVTLTGNQSLKEFDSATDCSDGQNYLMLNWGLTGPKVARVTVSYGKEQKEYPALKADGVYVAMATTPRLNYTHPPVGYVHAYDANGDKLYDTPLD